MTTIADVGAPAPGPAPAMSPAGRRGDHRGSWIPTWGMITTRCMELRRRRGLMIALIAVNIGIPVVFLAVRLISHAVDPKSFGPAGGYSIFTTLVAGFMYVFGFVVAAVVGCTAGSIDLTEGMFRHLVITGRSRLALYFARIPAGLAIVIAIVAVGYTIVCAVCVFAAPTQLSYDGVNVPAGLSKPALDTWAADHADQVICNFNFGGPGQNEQPPPNVTCGGQSIGPPPGTVIQTKGGGTFTVPASRIAGADSGVRGHGGQPGLRRLLHQLLVPLDVADGRRGALDRARGDHRVHRRPRAGLADGTADRPGHPPHHPRADHDADLQPPHHHVHAQCPAGHRGCGHGSHRAGRTADAVQRWWLGWGSWREPLDPRVDPGVVTGDRRLARVLDRSRSVANEDAGCLALRRFAICMDRTFDVVEPCRGGRGTGIYAAPLYQCSPTARAMSEPTRTKTVNQVRLIWVQLSTLRSERTDRASAGSPSRMRSAAFVSTSGLRTSTHRWSHAQGPP